MFQCLSIAPVVFNSLVIKENDGMDYKNETSTVQKNSADKTKQRKENSASGLMRPLGFQAQVRH